MKLKNRLPIGLALACASIALLLRPASASASVTAGRTFSVASQSGLPATGTHFHDDHAGAFGNPPDLAEVGSLQDQAASSEECRGPSEFNLTGLSPGTATLDFYLLHPGGLFPGQNDHPFLGNIGVVAYTGNNADDIADYSASASAVGTFSTAGLFAGSHISFNVTSIYNSQLSGGSPSLGVRLQTNQLFTAGGAFTFDSFTLTVEPTPEPEPTSLALLYAGSFFALARRRRGC